MNEMIERLIENLPCGAGIYEILGDKFSVVYLNKRYRELVGRKLDELALVPVLDAVHPDDIKPLMDALGEAVRNGKSGECDLRILHGEGKYRLFHLSGSIAKENGKVIVYATYTPISEVELSYRRMLPVALEAMMASSSDLSFVKDKNLRYICCSRVFAGMVGLSDESRIAGMSDYDLFDRELADKYRADDKKIIESGEALVDFVEEIPSADGIVHYSSTSKYLLRDSYGNVIGLYGTGRDITEYREAYSQLKLLTDNIPGGIARYEVSPRGIRQLYISDGICTSCGYTREEYTKLSENDVTFAVMPDDRKTLISQLERLLEHGTPIDCIFRIVTKNNEEKWHNLKGSPSEKTGDRIIVNSAIFDVTEETNSKLHLERSRMAMEIASASSGVSFWLYDIPTRTIRLELQSVSPIGYPPELKNTPEALVKNGDIYPDDVSEHRRIYSEIDEGAERAEVTLRLRNRLTGKFEWQHIIYSRMTENTAIGFSANAELEQESLRSYEHELHLRHELVKDSDTYFQINLTTSVVEEYSSKYPGNGYVTAPAISDKKLKNTILGYIIDEDRAMVEHELFDTSLLRHFSAGDTSVSVEYRRYIGKRVRWFRATATILKKPASDEIIAFVSCRNIDIEKKNAIAVEYVMDEEAESLAVLEPDVGMLRTVKVKSGTSELCEHESFDFDKIYRELIIPTVEYLNNIDMSGHFLRGLINDILDLSKIESGKIELTEEPFTKEEFENNIKTVIKPLMDEKDITFSFKLNSGMSVILADKLRYGQIFFNLLSNAVKYTPSGGCVEFYSESVGEKRADGKHRVEYTVRDNGCGMSYEFQKVAFQPFSRENAGINTSVQGSGLGLAIVKNLVDTMGGSITVKSAPGSGTEFNVILYMSDVSGIELKAPEVQVSYEKLKGLHILLVEDNEMNIIVAKKLLERMGCVVYVATNGLCAVETFTKSEVGHYRIILMDVRMPVMDGIEATQNIRRAVRPDAQTVPIIAMTADAFNEDRNRTSEAGMNAHLAKPISSKLLYSTIAEFI